VRIRGRFRVAYFGWGTMRRLRLGRLPAAGVLLLRLSFETDGRIMTFIALLPVHPAWPPCAWPSAAWIEVRAELRRVAAGAHGIAELQLDLLVRPTRIQCARGVVSRGCGLRRAPAAGRQHAVAVWRSGSGSPIIDSSLYGPRFFMSAAHLPWPAHRITLSPMILCCVGEPG